MARRIILRNHVNIGYNGAIRKGGNAQETDAPLLHQWGRP